MLNTSDIYTLLSNQYHEGNIKDTGYDCVNGNKYVDVRNVVFEVDKPYVIDENPVLRMDDEWYVKNYESRINSQLVKLLDKVSENPLTRQAILLIMKPDAYEKEDFTCTIYTHVFLDKVNENEYDIEYSVHMRSNDAVDFVGDVKWNNKIYDKIIESLVERNGWKLNKKNMIWCADSFQLSLDCCKKYF